MRTEEHGTFKEPSPPRQLREDPTQRAKACLPNLLFRVLTHYQDALTSLLNDTFLQADQKLLDLLAETHIREEIDSYNHTLTHLRQHRTQCVESFKAHLAEQFIALYTHAENDLPISDKKTASWSVVSNTELDLVLNSEAIARRAHDNKALPIDAVNSCFEQALNRDITLADLPIGPMRLLRCLVASGHEAQFDDPGLTVLLQTAETHLVSRLSNAYEGTLKVFTDHAIHPKPKVVSEKHITQKRSAKLGPDVRGGKDVGRGTPSNLSSTVGASAHTHGPVAIPDELLSLLLPMVDKVADRTYEKTHHHQNTVDMLLKVLERKHLLSKLSPAHTHSLNTVKQTFAGLQSAKELSDTSHALFDSLLPAVVKATLQEPVFLNRTHSDGRELIKLLSAMDFYWHGNQDNPHAARARQIVDKLAHSSDSPAEAFKEALTEVKTLYQEEDRRTQMIEKRIETAEQGKAKTTQIKHQVLDEISGVIRHYQVEQDISFLMQNAWRQVMFYDGLRFGLESKEWRTDIKILVRLAKLDYYASIWRNQARLSAFFNTLFSDIKHSLVRIGINGFKLEKLTQAFSKAFDRIKSKRTQACDKPEKTIASILSESRIPSEKDRIIAQREAAEHRSDVGEEPPSNDVRVTKAFERIGQFERGQEFDLSLDGQMKRCRLAAIIDQTQSYIFVNCRGCKVAEYTRTALARHIASHNAVPVACDCLFDRILEKIIAQRSHPEMAFA